jgi:hypothetical protein
MQINKIRDDKVDIIIDINEIQSMIRKYFRTYSNKLENLEKIVNL